MSLKWVSADRVSAEGQPDALQKNAAGIFG